MRHAEKMDSEALPKALQTPLITRAAEELRMLTQTDIERERYEARRKAQLDRNSEIKEMRILAEQVEQTRILAEQAEQRGMKIGAIQLCERLLQLPESPQEKLNGMLLEELTQLADQLQARVQGRK